MPSDQMNNLPAEVDDMPESARNIFLAAYSSSKEDGMDEQAAIQVGYNTIKDHYEQGSDGKWFKKPEETNIHNKAVPSGGN